MTKPVSALYRAKHPDLVNRITTSIERGVHLSPTRPQIFFRADDVGIPSKTFCELISCFQKHGLPLCLASVPSWTTRNRQQELYRLTGAQSGQWSWHQHGHTHRNFESTGKKQEFGPSRNNLQIENSIKSGRNRLEIILETDFFPVFTPPWNRCSAETLNVLDKLDFHGVSRSKGAQPKPSSGLPDFRVNVDLHTRKEKIPAIALEKLLEELTTGIASGLCGVMIHHQRMNKLAVEFLDIFLQHVCATKTLSPVRFNDLIT